MYIKYMAIFGGHRFDRLLPMGICLLQGIRRSLHFCSNIPLTPSELYPKFSGYGTTTLTQIY